MDYGLHAEPGHINFSPAGFRRVAQDLLRCADAFNPEGFSVVPYFLYSRAMELALKATHLEGASQQQVKMDFGHDLVASYDALPARAKLLSSDEGELLSRVNALYMRKAFEYMQVGDAMRGFGEFPNLEALCSLAKRIVN
jgi:hypothetical protein